MLVKQNVYYDYSTSNKLCKSTCGVKRTLMVHCNYKETTGSYSVITEHLLLHSFPNVDIIFNIFI